MPAELGTVRRSLEDSGVLWLDEVNPILDAIEPHLREAVATAFMAGVKFGGQMPTLKETFEERDWRAGRAVEQWRSAR